jgi:hypothetical protein
LSCCNVIQSAGAGEAGGGKEAAVAVGTWEGRSGSALTRMFARSLPAALAPGLLATGLTMPPIAGTAQTQPEAAEEQSCAVSGEQILAGNIVRAAAYQEQFSRYSPQANRCFVEMRVLTIAVDQHADHVGRFLYDGQTKELLAFAEIRDGKKSGRVFDLNHRTQSFKNGGWDDASEYIYTMMAGDR